MTKRNRSIWRRLLEQFSGKPEDSDRIKLIAKHCKHDIDTSGVCSRCGLHLHTIILNQSLDS